MTSTETPAGKPKFSGLEIIATTAPYIFLLLWGSGFGVAKVGLQHVEPLTFLTLRFGIIVVVVTPLFFIMRPSKPTNFKDWFHIAFVGVMMQAVYFGAAFTGMSLGVSVGAAAVIASTQPLIVALASPFVTGERLSGLKWLGLLIGAAGAVTVVVAGTRFDGTIDYGLAFSVLSALGMSAGTLYQKRFPVVAHPVTVNFVHYWVGLLGVLPLALMLETMQVEWAGELIAALSWLVVANSIVAISLLLFMIRRSDASRVSALFFLVPPVSAVYGWALLGEVLTAGSLAGMGLTVFGVWLVSRH
ncbi:DMT family transporter [Rhizobium sp. L1K21]|uniref:DMT family transporter n=1 Tax=Rhizobium sp. L1K21 TaxID=2954933 RepID=UPI00209289C7|nr:DMT family transporter [Rhizobium sp. L1K21]MCO6185365.1 DMT family transporter [Rhizobium sp. L1K21]